MVAVKSIRIVLALAIPLSQCEPAMAGGACYSGAVSAGYTYQSRAYYTPTYSYYQAPAYQAPAYYGPKVVIASQFYPAYAWQYQPDAVATVKAPVKVVAAKAPVLDEATRDDIARRVVERIAPALVAASVTSPVGSVGDGTGGYGLDEEETGPPSPVRSGGTPERRPGEFTKSEIEELGAKCYRCHNPRQTKGNLRLFGDKGEFSPAYSDGRTLSADDRIRIYEMTQPAEDGGPPQMPSGAEGNRSQWLSKEASERIREWAGLS